MAVFFYCQNFSFLNVPVDCNIYFYIILHELTLY